MVMKWPTAILVGLFAMGLAATANAASVGSLVQFGSGGVDNTFHDSSLEVGIDSSGNPLSATDSLDIGDSIRGIFNMTQIRFPSGPDADLSDNNVELTGVFQLLISDKIPTSSGYDYYFKPDTNFAEATSLFGTSDSGAMVLFYEQSPGDYVSDPTLAHATNGTFFLALGFTSSTYSSVSGSSNDDYTDAGEEWVARDVPGSPSGLGTTQSLGKTGYLALNRILGAGGSADGWALATQDPGLDGSVEVEITGFSTFWLSPTDTTWPVHDQTNMDAMIISVPVPGAAAAGLLMLSLLGIGRFGFARKRRSARA
jgi:hypothetical protein